jgi:protein-L-isoaspartate O-methyltransferase
MSAGDEEEAYHQGTASMSTAGGLGDAEGFVPLAPSSPRTLTEPAREIPVHAETQVLVVGGGPAGCAAALAARRAGRVVGIDRSPARRTLARAPGRLPRHGHLVADDRPGMG